ncbi:MAG TPA: hypothetical protein VGF48_08455 [Thermoanaerobaculia bacterium]|jgi:hypothetical protein
MTETSVAPITTLQPSEQQHMLLLFLPVQKGIAAALSQNTNALLSAAGSGTDLRAATGVHFFMFHGVSDGGASSLPVPTFQSAAGKDLFVVMSIYDAPFTPYISAFTSNAAIANGLNLVLQAMDETNIVPPTDPTSAAYILAHGGVFKNSANFISLLMRYNFADPAIPAATGAGEIVNPQPNPKYFLGATFPGLTAGAILQSYPSAGALWPQPAVPITYVPTVVSASPATATIPIAEPAVPLVPQSLPIAAKSYPAPDPAAVDAATAPVDATTPPEKQA